MTSIVPSKRKLEIINYDQTLFNTLLSSLGVVAIGGQIRPAQGRIATNIIQETDKGKLFIRIYAKNTSKLETGDPLFEVESLKYFSERGIVVPSPLKFGSNYFYETYDLFVLGYFMLPGTPAAGDCLTPRVCYNMGKFLSEMLTVSVNFTTERNHINSFLHILKSAELLELDFPSLKDIELWSAMKESTKLNINILEGTPLGIVHGDYFYENILINETEEVLGVIDFGDSYYGHVVHDVSIGAMEACVVNGAWDFSLFESFMTGVAPFLVSLDIDFEQFFEALRADCLRFAVYTIPLMGNKGLQENLYIQRYKLLSEKIKEKLRLLFFHCLKK